MSSSTSVGIDKGAVEFGSGIVPSRQRSGYPTEAAKATVDYALGRPDVTDVFPDVESTYPVSVRVLEKAGLQRRSANAGPLRYLA